MGKKHEAFEKAASAQEERFAALERLTTFELKDMKRRQDEDLMRQQDLIDKQKEQTRRSKDPPASRSEAGSVKGETGSQGQGEVRKIRPSFQPPVSGGRPPSEVRSSPGSPPSSHTGSQTPR